MNRPRLLGFEAKMGLSITLSFFLVLYTLLLLFFRCPEWKDKKDLSLCFLLVADNELCCTNRETGTEYHTRIGGTDKKPLPSGQS